MGIFKKLFGSRDLLSMFEDPRSAIRAHRILEEMEPSEVVSLLINSLQHHRSSVVRARCIRLLLAYDLDETALRIIMAAMDDPSAEVRHSAVSFFGLRGSQGRPVHASLSHLINTITKENRSIEGDKFHEMAIMMSIPMAAAAAIMGTVGAQKLLIPYDRKPVDLERFKRELERLQSDSDDPILREDAKKYLKHLFGI